MLQSALHPSLPALPTRVVSCLLRRGWGTADDLCVRQGTAAERCLLHARGTEILWGSLGKQCLKRCLQGEPKTRRRLRRKAEITSGRLSVFMGPGPWSPRQELLFRCHCWQESTQRSLWQPGGWARGWALGKPWISGSPTSHVTSPSQTFRGQGASPHPWPRTHTQWVPPGWTPVSPPVLVRAQPVQRWL